MSPVPRGAREMLPLSIGANRWPGTRARLRPLGPLLAGLFLAGLAACTTTTQPAVRLGPHAQARSYLEGNAPARAIPLLEALHQEQPDNLEIARTLTEAHVKHDGGTRLLARLTSGSRASPAKLSATELYMLGLTYFAQPGGAKAQAVEAFQKAIALSPDEPELHYRLGLVLLESEDYQGALPSLAKAFALSPARASYALPLAKAQHRTGHPREAVKSLQLALEAELRPADLRLARALMDEIADPLGKVPSALRPKLEEALVWLQERDLPQEAIVRLEEILREFPDLAPVHALLGLAYHRLDDAGRAVDELKRAIELAPDDGRTHYYLGEIYLARQRPDRATEHLQRAVALHPYLDDAYARLGDLALERGEPRQARDLFRRLTRLQPEAVAPRGKLALALQQLQAWPEAEAELLTVHKQRPDDPEFLLRLGILHMERLKRASTAAEKQSATEQASHWLRETLRIQPDNVLASRALETLNRR